MIATELLYLQITWTQKRQVSAQPPDCSDQETIEHFLVICPFYDQCRARLKELWKNSKTPILNDLLTAVLTYPSHELVPFILDASVHPLLISYAQTYGNELLTEVFHLTRTLCYTLHRARLKLLKVFKWHLCAEGLSWSSLLNTVVASTLENHDMVACEQIKIRLVHLKMELKFELK